MQPPDETSAEAEHQHHHYVGNDIPWYVRLIWVAFWALAIYYVVVYFFPSIRLELLNRP